MLGNRTFTQRNEAFTCLHCGAAVPPQTGSCRNHCPECLWSLHVDQNPGDRAADCGGLMEPVAVELSGKKGRVLVHRCRSCGEVRRNRAAPDDSFAALLAVIELAAAQYLGRR